MCGYGNIYAREVGGSAPKRVRLSDILVTVLVSLVLGVIYHFWGSVYNLLKPLFFEADELLYGMWFAADHACLLANP